MIIYAVKLSEDRWQGTNEWYDGFYMSKDDAEKHAGDAKIDPSIVAEVVKIEVR